MKIQSEQFIPAIQYLLNTMPDKLQSVTNPHGISTARLCVLRYLIDNGPSSLISIAKHRKVSAATMSRLVASLVTEGYLIQAQSKSDRRSKLFLVTTLARQKVAEENQDQITLLNERLKYLTDDEKLLILKSTQLLQNVL